MFNTKFDFDLEALRAARDRTALRCPLLAPSLGHELLMRRDGFRATLNPDPAFLLETTPGLLQTPGAPHRLLERRELRVGAMSLIAASGLIKRPLGTDLLALYWLAQEDARLLFCGREIARIPPWRRSPKVPHFFGDASRTGACAPLVHTSLWSHAASRDRLAALCPDLRDLPLDIQPFGSPLSSPYRGCQHLGANIFFAHVLLSNQK